ncbi:MAG: aldose 1-epimerase, partial [Planctomycetales bacterium]|nr:aldose 1-epimerase [Planctomycetales bacterium]
MNPITLRTAAGASARIAAHLGFNCYEFKAVVDGLTTDVLWAALGFGVDPEQRPSGSGIPLLFPFPGRIRGTSFTWQDKTYPLEAADGRGNAIHGFVYTRPWRVTEQSETRVVGQFQASVDDPSLLERWPSDFRITATYELSDDRLTLTLTFENPGQAPLPFGFGAHPYFRLPLGGNDAGECRVQVPVRDHWPLQ